MFIFMLVFLLEHVLVFVKVIPVFVSVCVLYIIRLIESFRKRTEYLSEGRVTRIKYF